VDKPIIKGYIYNLDLEIYNYESNSNSNYDNPYKNYCNILTFTRDNYYDIWDLLYDDFTHKYYGFNNNILIIELIQNNIQNKLKNMKDMNLIKIFLVKNKT